MSFWGLGDSAEATWVLVGMQSRRVQSWRDGTGGLETPQLPNSAPPPWGVAHGFTHPLQPLAPAPAHLAWSPRTRACIRARRRRRWREMQARRPRCRVSRAWEHRWAQSCSSCCLPCSRSRTCGQRPDMGVGACLLFSSGLSPLPSSRTVYPGVPRTASHPALLHLPSICPVCVDTGTHLSDSKVIEP